MDVRGNRAPRILCVNCNICVNNFRRYPVLEQETRVTSMLCSWIYPFIATEDDYVCEACWELAMAAVNQYLQNEVAGNDDPQQAGPSHRGHAHVCLLCGRSCLRRQRNRILRENPTETHQSMINIIESRIAPRQISSSDELCQACRLQVERQARRRIIADELRSTSEVSQPEDEYEHTDTPENQGGSDERRSNAPNHSNSEDDEQSQPFQDVPMRTVPPGQLILPNYRRAANTGNHCIFPYCDSTTLHGIPDQLRATIVGNHNYYIPKLARACDEHLRSNSWDMLYDSENSMDVFTVDQVEHVFSFVNAFKPTMDFDNFEEMDSRMFEHWIGMSQEKFRLLLQEVPRILEIRRGQLGLAAFLLKLRNGDSDERIASLVQMPRRSLEKLMDQVREVLLQDFVPRNLGISHINREQLLNHNLIIPNGLYGSEGNATAIVICDGTYIYIHKSANYMFQKKTYSLHKYQNLCKPFMIVASDGYIVDCYGPYSATTSDAEIMTSLFRDEQSPLRAYFREGDVFILDRGFRDSIGLLQECGYQPYMTETLLEGEHQLTTAQANRSRCVTICRWVVEVVNGYFKRDFKLFRQEYFHRPLPHMMQNFQIAAALLNRFGARLRNNEYATEILYIISERINYENNLAIMVESINMNRRSSAFQSITADRDNLLYFPELEYRDLILFALGTYQIRQARSYYGEHVRFHGGYRIEVSTEPINSAEYTLRGSGDTTLIRGKIKSRHISRRQYFVYILIENNISGRPGIPEYCCNCLVGRRTIGCCAHVMTLVWYLGWARHQERLTAPAEFLDDILIREDDE